MKRILSTLAILLVFAAFIFFFVIGGIVDQQMNVCMHVEDDDYDISQKALDLHASLNVADWHSDVLLWDRNILSEATHGHTDVPRLIKGGFALQVFDAVIKTPKGLNYHQNTGDTDQITLLAMANRWPIKTWGSLYERALYQSKKLYKAAERSNGKLRVITTQQELTQLINDRARDIEVVGGMLSIEGLHALEGEISHLDELYEVGYRMMGPVHFFDNLVGGSSAGVEQYGLTDFGRQVIRRMDELGILVDLAHASPALIDDVLSTTSRPVVVSHTGVQGTFDSPRNLTDDQLRRIAARGGMIGVGFWDGAVGDPRPESIARSMRYVSDLIGVEHVCLGSDWDGGTTTYFDAAHVAVLTEALMEVGFSAKEIRMIMGENQLQFLLKYLPS